MCGIFGIISLKERLAPEAKELVARGTSMLKHRGPDDYGLDEAGQACLGHARLSIIDIAGGHQPMWDREHSCLISYNGETYNFVELRSGLERLGHIFKTRSDTEVVLKAFSQWGTDCLKYLRGMFAFAAIDLRRNKAILARDRLGEKPLFYTVNSGSIIFSSELEPLYKTAGPFKISLDALDEYLHWQYIPAPSTIYKNVYSLEPGSYIEIDLEKGSFSKRKYWHLDFCEDRSISMEEWERRIDEGLREAVRLRLVSDVPFGAFLSGGVDSSLITGYMAEILEQPVKTFSIGFKEADFSELEFAEKIARINKTEHRSEIVEADSLGLLPLLALHYGQPFADSSAIPTYYVCRMARKFVKMVLSGDGGDENFAGYNSYEYVLKGIENKISGFHDQLSFTKRLSRIGYYYYAWLKQLASGASVIDRAYDLHCHTSKHFAPAERKELLLKEYREIVREHSPARKKLMELENQPLICRLQHLDIMSYLPFDILTKVDIASMANSLEVRIPMLDHRIVELAATLPAELKLKEEKAGGRVSYQKKYILKRIALNHYPEELIERPKMGFGVPLRVWFADKLRPALRQRLVNSNYLPAFFDKNKVEELVDMHSEKNDCSAKLWNLLFLDQWLSTHKESLP